MGVLNVKQSGLGDLLFIGGYNLSGDIGSLQRIGGGPAPLVVTGINKSAMERIGGKRDGSMAFNAYHNDAAVAPVGAHTRLSLLPTGDVMMIYCRGGSLGSPAAGLIGKQLNYDGTRAEDGMLTYAVEQPGNGFALEWGVSLTAGERTDTTATNGSGVDLGSVSPGAFGLQAYLEVTAFTGTSATIAIQESSDNGAGDAYAAVTGGAFSTVTGITTERIATAAINVEQWLRVVTTGTFSNLKFVVMATRNPVAVTF